MAATATAKKVIKKTGEAAKKKVTKTGAKPKGAPKPKSAPNAKPKSAPKNNPNKKGPILKSNEAIDPNKKGGLFNADPVLDFFVDGFTGIGDAGKAYSRIAKEMGDDAKMFDVGKKALKEVYQNKDGSYNVSKIAGSYMVAAGGLRAVGGGGLYKNGQGQTDIVGIPFI